jgi:hypothetical protein
MVKSIEKPSDVINIYMTDDNTFNATPANQVKYDAKIDFRCEASRKERIRAIASIKGLTISGLVIQIIDQYMLNEYEGHPPMVHV